MGNPRKILPLGGGPVGFFEDLAVENLGKPSRQEGWLGVHAPEWSDRTAQAQVLETKFDFARIDTHVFSWVLRECRPALPLSGNGEVGSRPSGPRGGSLCGKAEWGDGNHDRRAF
ncbi:hypothetical protein BMS3Bbin13_00087 [bacterium BMS3Bbin13]|nr:hypothetical protein BMS3Bbin13_00087 [bacterium BMS3Bbin13]